MLDKQSLCLLADHIRLKLLYFGRATVDSAWNGTVASPVFSRLYYIVSGEAYITVNGERMPLTPHRWYLIPAGVSFEYECVREMDHLYYHIKLCDFAETDLLCTARRPLILENLPLPISELTTVRDALRLRQQLLDMVLSFLDAYDVDIRRALYSPCIMGALQYIHQHLSMQLTVAEIADYSSVSPSTLTKRFRTELMVSVSEYIDTLVMTKAEQRLRNGTESVAAISDALGFSDQFYFSKRFKQKFGVSPREYRNRKSL